MSLYLKEIDVDDLSCSNPFVSGSWAAIKKNNGWSSKAFVIVIDDMRYEILILIRTIKFGYSLAYIPFAPYPLEGSQLYKVADYLSLINLELVKHQSKSVFAIRYDFPFNYEKADLICSIDKSLFKINSESVQPVTTTFINLEEDLIGIRANYRKRARRHIKKNDGFVIVEEYNKNLEELSTWYSIYKSTGIADGFSTRPFSYIERLMEMDNSKLLIAKVDNKVVGGIIILYGSETAIYLLGGSLKDCGYSVSYTLQDEAIKFCKLQGLKYYDLFGIGSKKAKHLNSLNLFKTSFGGSIINRVPTFDYPIHSIVYSIFNLAEFVRYTFCRR